MSQLGCLVFRGIRSNPARISSVHAQKRQRKRISGLYKNDTLTLIRTSRCLHAQVVELVDTHV